uniref:Cytochrome c oxidase subunit 7B, mitochondrial n=1 Tax=Myotis lucifugus TaxID=59463 RepID=G1Q9C8_MYOLU
KFPLTQNLLSHLSVRTGPPEMDTDFHDKYGNTVLGSGATFCVATWTCTATRTGIEWNLSPVGRITPKEWRGQ